LAATIIRVLGLTEMVFMFVNKMVKNHYDQKNSITQKEILELEIKKQENHLKPHTNVFFVNVKFDFTKTILKKIHTCK